MTTADVIIGAGFGDEGKGLVTDALAARYGQEAIVIRFNGGAQAGHTVVTPQGQRHVFSHFGCGSFVGARTFLSRFFVSNPLLFFKEWQKLQALNVTPIVAADPQGWLTTPYDMMINQIVEEARAGQRHGSCGVGFGETIERCEKSAYFTTIQDIAWPENLRKTLKKILDEWVPFRLKTLGINSLGDSWTQRLHADGIINKYMEDTAFMHAHISLTPISSYCQNAHLVFEGAQGLLLDQTRGFFPHVTRSHTGLKNVVDLAATLNVKALDVHYLTRSYLTRHGAGPFATETEKQPYAKIVDLTNVPNPYQGKLRFGWLDCDQLVRAITQDLESAPRALQLRPHLAMTCLDQLDNHHVTCRLFGQTVTKTVEEVQSDLAQLIPISSLFGSYGPTRSTLERRSTHQRFLSIKYYKHSAAKSS